MNASELAQKMLVWEQQKRSLDALTAEIEAAVLELGQTQTVGSVRATYSGGRKSFAYDAAATQVGVTIPQELVDEHTQTTQRIDWKAICEVAGVTDIPFTQSEPSVSVKLL